VAAPAIHAGEGALQRSEKSLIVKDALQRWAHEAAPSNIYAIASRPENRTLTHREEFN
jgi:hypothetical protein